MKGTGRIRAGKRRTIFKSIFFFLLINFMLTIFIGYYYIINTPGLSDLVSYFYVHIALISNFLIIYLVIFVILVIIATLLPSKILIVLVSVPLIFLFHTILFIDVTIYHIFKFHINSMVLNLFQTEGAWDSVKIGTPSFITLGIILTIILLFEIILFNRLFNKIKSNTEKYKFKSSFIALLVAVIFMIILIDKFTFAFSDLYNKTKITRYSKLYPLYLPLTIKRFMRSKFNFRLEREESFDFNKKAQSLNYPKKPLKRKSSEDYPNIIFIIIDAMRYDMFNADVTPHIYRFSKNAIVFKNHYSGGNASRFGIFSLLYGVYSYYWHQFLAERQSSILIDELIALNYDFVILSSTKLTYPEFRRTAFIKIPDKIMDTLPGANSAERDIQLADYFINWLKNYNNEKPFFAFLFFDAPHGPYSYPDKFDKFLPSKKTANYITVNEKDALLLKNSYKNAIYFDDYLTGKIISFLKNNGFLKNTLVLITGDHGEEFYERGFLGHTSAFSKEQAKVPMLLYIPGYKHQEIEYLTSHIDVVPTILSFLGYTNSTEDYSHGKSLFEKENRNFVVVGGWDDCAIIDKDYTIVFSTESYNISTFEVRNRNYSLVDDYEQILKNRFDRIYKIIKKFGEFTK